MLLKCISDRIPVLTVGETYDVALLYEFPDRIIIRRPGEPWSKPWEGFGIWHLMDAFEEPEGQMDVVFCGYKPYEEEFYGVMVPMGAVGLSLFEQVRERGFDGEFDIVIEGIHRGPGIHKYVDWWINGKFKNWITVGYTFVSVCKVRSFDRLDGVIHQVMCALEVDPADFLIGRQEIFCWMPYDHRPGS